MAIGTAEILLLILFIALLSSLLYGGCKYDIQSTSSFFRRWWRRSVPRTVWSAAARWNFWNCWGCYCIGSQNFYLLYPSWLTSSGEEFSGESDSDQNRFRYIVFWERKNSPQWQVFWWVGLWPKLFPVYCKLGEKKLSSVTSFLVCLTLTYIRFDYSKRWHLKNRQGHVLTHHQKTRLRTPTPRKVDVWK